MQGVRVSPVQWNMRTFAKLMKILQDTEETTQKAERGILCSDNGLRSDPSIVDEYLQV